MDSISKSLSLLLIVVLLITSSLLIIQFATAQTIPKPSVPKFTITVFENGYQMDISNQPIILNGHDMAGIFYDIRIKSHSTENWVHKTVPNATQAIRGYIQEMGQSGNTTLTSDFKSIRHLLNLSSESQQIDFQVEAINGYPNMTLANMFFGIEPDKTPIITVNTSGWSESQTITIPEINNQKGTDLLLATVIVWVSVAILVVVVSLLLFRRHRKTSNLKQ
jgi:hypothetical protein